MKICYVYCHPEYMQMESQRRLRFRLIKKGKSPMKNGLQKFTESVSVVVKSDNRQAGNVSS